MSGPLINKTDGGPGRLSREASSIEFRDKMAQIGMYILLSLPNGTECTAELDQLCSEFKPACNKNTRRIVALKMLRRVQARKRLHQKEVQSKDQSHLQDLEDILDTNEDFMESNQDFMEGNPDDEIEAEEYEENDEILSVRVGKSVCNVKIGNSDLPFIVNGLPDNPIEMRPFDRYFYRTRILSYWIARGFLSMTQNAVNNPKVRYELGEGGTLEEASNRLELLVSDYEELG